MPTQRKLERLEKRNKNNRTSRHHIISQCQKDLFNVFEDNNIKRLTQKQHQALHTLFTDENWPIHQPKLQLEEFERIIEGVLSKKAIELFNLLISMSDDEFYKKGLVK